jgi:cysteine desulfurase
MTAQFPVYLDYMASTPLDPKVLARMTDCLSSTTDFGNPSSQNHRFGWQAGELIKAARRQVAALINADPREILWTSGATEAINLALKGAAQFYQRKGKHIITSRTEHKAVLNTCAYLENQGFEVTYLTPSPHGLLDIDQFRAAIRPDTILASILWVNNETGVIQDVERISRMTREHGIILHVDAAQAAGKIAIDVKTFPVDLMSFSAHKVYGPKGVGALFMRRSPRIRLTPQIHGGEQEGGLRSGTLPTHQIVGMGEAFETARLSLCQDQEHVRQLSARLWQGLQSLGGIELNGDKQQRVGNCLNMSVNGVEAETLALSLTGLAVSTGSACHTAHTTPSHVLTAMGCPPSRALSSLRISLGRFTTLAEIEYAIAHIREQVQQLRQLSPVWTR